MGVVVLRTYQASKIFLRIKLWGDSYCKQYRFVSSTKTIAGGARKIGNGAETLHCRDPFIEREQKVKCSPETFGFVMGSESTYVFKETEGRSSADGLDRGGNPGIDSFSTNADQVSWQVL